MELPVGYHRDDFLLLLDHGDSLNGYRLGQEEKAFSAALRSRSLAAHRLYVRLASHKGPLFRSERLHYGEIGNVSDPAAELEAAGLLANDRPSDVRDALGLLRRGDCSTRVTPTGWASGSVPSVRPPRRCYGRRSTPIPETAA